MVSAIDIVDGAARRQWSLVTRQQMLDAGISRDRISKLLRSGSLRRMGHRVYATFGSPTSWEQDVMAAVLSASPNAVASHAAAARLWNFAHLPADGTDVTVEFEAGSFRRVRGRGVHTTRILPPADLAERSGIPCTSFERTLCDCTTLLSPFQLGRVLDDGLRRRDAALDRLLRCAARLDSGPGRRLAIVKQLLSQRDASFDPGGSASELGVLQVLRDAGLPEPVQQFEVSIDGRRYVLDFAWPAFGVCVEYYGLAVHSGASAVAHDSRRSTDLVASGWRPLIFTESTPDREIVRRVKRLLTTDQSDWSARDPTST